MIKASYTNLLFVIEMVRVDGADIWGQTVSNCGTTHEKTLPDIKSTQHNRQ